MTRLHFVKKARKAIPDAEVAVGDSYYWWKFRRGGKHVSKTRPRRSALTQSEFYSAMYDHEDAVAEIDLDDLDQVAEDLRAVASEIESLGAEQQDKHDNLPENFQEGDTGQLLTTRAEECEAIAQSISQAADEIDDIVQDDERSPDAKRIDAQAALDGIDWSYS